MVARGIDYTTIVLDPRYDNLPGVRYYEVEVAGEPVRFAQHDRSVLPAMLQELVSALLHSHKSQSDPVGRWGLAPWHDLCHAGLFVG